MINLLRADFYKLSKSRSFYVCCLLCIVLSGIMLASYAFLQVMFQEMPAGMMEELNMAAGMQSGGVSLQDMLGGFDGSMMLELSFSGNTLQILLAIFASIFVSAEFSNGTMKNTASRGFARWKIYLSQLITVTTAAFIMMLLIAVFCTAGGTVLWGFGAVEGNLFLEILRIVGLQLLLNAAVAGLFVMIAMLLRNIGAAIAVNICVLSFLPTVFQLVNIISRGKVDVGRYFLTDNITNLSSLNPSGEHIIQGILVGVIYLIVTTGIGWLFFKRQDIK